MTAYYEFNQNVFANNVNEVCAAYKRNGVNRMLLSYSYKTNNTLRVQNAVRDNNLLAEVVSPDELKAAKLTGHRPRDIVYNGVIPDPFGKIEVMAHEGIVNVDNVDELITIVDVINRSVREGHLRHYDVLPIGLRINIDVGNGINSRFGIEYGSADYAESLRIIKECKNLRLGSIHNHAYGTRDLVYYKPRVELMAKIGKDLCVPVIDLGSGMYGFMDQRLVEWFGGDIPTFDDYARITAEALDKEFHGSQPTIVLELGTPLIANAVKLIAHVTNIKTIRGVDYVTLDCSMFDVGFTNRKANPPLDVKEIGDKRINVKDVNLLGYTCMESDIVYRGFSGSIAVGDELVFSNCGAYTVSLENNFISKPLPFFAVHSP